MIHLWILDFSAPQALALRDKVFGDKIGLRFSFLAPYSSFPSPHCNTLLLQLYIYIVNSIRILPDFKKSTEDKVLILGFIHSWLKHCFVTAFITVL